MEAKKWPAGSGEILLTFDDGPSEVVSEELLDVLSKHQVNATFCLIGRNVEASPQLAKRMVDEGHSIVAHSYEHRTASLLSGSELSRGNERWLTLVEQQGLPRSEVRHFRPPLGLKTPTVMREVRKRDWEYAHLTFFVNDAYADKTTAPQVMAKIKKHRGGAIVLHEMRYKAGADLYEIDKSWLPEAVDDLICWGSENGFRFTTCQPTP